MIGPAGARAAQQHGFTVVVDAGHGGHDSGAVDNGVKEKDVNLAVAQKLAALIKKKLKNVNVVLTRNDDSFISLQERANIANRNRGNLFISIHTNSVDKSSPNRATAKGTSVYALGPQKDANNLRVAQRENSVIELENGYKEKYSGFDPKKDESYIIFEMAQKSNLNQSLRFAHAAQRELVSTAGRVDKGVKQAGFWVLWATSMPSVLVELDFICNPESAKFLSSEKGQEKFALALCNAVDSYMERTARRTALVNRPADKAGTGDRVQTDNKAKRSKKSGKESKRSQESETAVVEQPSQPEADGIPVLATPYDESDRRVRKERTTASRERSYAQTRQGRKRRSASSRQQSDSREIDAKVIVVRSEADYMPRVQEPDKKVQQTVASDDSSKSKSKKKKAKKARSVKTPKKQDQKVMADNRGKSSDKKDNNKDKNKNEGKTRIVVSGKGQVTTYSKQGQSTKVSVKTTSSKRHTSLAGKRK